MCATMLKGFALFSFFNPETSGDDQWVIIHLFPGLLFLNWDPPDQGSSTSFAG